MWKRASKCPSSPIHPSNHPIPPVHTHAKVFESTGEVLYEGLYLGHGLGVDVEVC